MWKAVQWYLMCIYVSISFILLPISYLGLLSHSWRPLCNEKGKYKKNGFRKLPWWLAGGQSKSGCIFVLCKPPKFWPCYPCLLTGWDVPTSETIWCTRYPSCGPSIRGSGSLAGNIFPAALPPWDWRRCLEGREGMTCFGSRMRLWCALLTFLR